MCAIFDVIVVPFKLLRICQEGSGLIKLGIVIVSGIWLTLSPSLLVWDSPPIPCFVSLTQSWYLFFVDFIYFPPICFLSCYFVLAQWTLKRFVQTTLGGLTNNRSQIWLTVR